MNESKYPSVTITFDGMMLFRFDGRDKNNRRCEVMFRKAHDHKIEVIVKKKRGNRDSEELCRLTHDELRGYKYLWLYVENYGEKRDYENTGTAKRGGWYDRILRLDGGEFYGEPLKLKSDRYKPTMYVCDGYVGAENSNGREKGSDERWGLSRVDTCFRVEDKEQGAYSYKELKYSMSIAKWKKLKDNYSQFINPLNRFLRWVNTTIDLTPGQNLMLMGESDDERPNPFPLITNYQGSDAYWIHIKYTDSDTPDSLEDCKGLGHHCEAFDKYSGQSLSTIYSVFSPRSDRIREPTAPWERINIMSSDVPCCLSACVNQEDQ